MSLDGIYQILEETTQEFRKGEEVVERDVGQVHVTDIFAMPHESGTPADLQLVDLHFITVGVDQTKAEARREDLVRLLNGYPQPERLAGGPSYIEVGGVLGDQGTALRLFALGEVLGLWQVITPSKLGVTGPEGNQLAGMGLVMISGYKP